MENNHARPISGASSIFLDALRICAALTVLYIHAFDRWFPTLAHEQSKPGEPSHAAVIVFFVLSGYVIAHTTISKNRGGLQYAQARLARLSSMVIPALVITALIQIFIAQTNPQMLSLYTRGGSITRYVLSGLFVNEFWLFSAAPPLNGSLWSLSFEFWYYAIFGLWFFRNKGWKSMLIPLAACLFAGPKILLMMPVWLAGYFAYSLPRPSISILKSWIFVFVFLIIAWFTVEIVPAIPFIIGYKPLYYANQFFTDWITGVFTAGALWMLPATVNRNKNRGLAKWFRKAADLTFPLYVLHFPFLILWMSLFGHTLNNDVQLWEAMISVLIASALIGIGLEKQRFVWVRFFKWLLNSFSKNPLKKSVDQTTENIA